MDSILQNLGISSTTSGTFAGTWLNDQTAVSFTSRSPIDDAVLGTVQATTEALYHQTVTQAAQAFDSWRMLPAPKRGEVIRAIAEELRAKKQLLAKLITLEMGKILPEAEGEVQEIIDIADFAVGLSRQLCGQTMHSERPFHRMYEQWHPLGIVGVITAFNFPAAVWGWNAMLAAVCGDVVLWKPSELTPLTAIALTHICAQVAESYGYPGLFTLVTDTNAEIGKLLASDKRIPLVSATGSCAMGRVVGATVASRHGKSLLELGGNNALIVLADANLELATRAILFGAIGTAGQRCTTTRRLLVETSVVNDLTTRLVKAYKQIRIGNPLDGKTLMGPLVAPRAVEGYQLAIKQALSEGGEILCGGKVLSGMPSSLYVEPTLIRASATMEIMQHETFAPILYLVPVHNLEEAIAIQNGVSQGLSSALFTSNLHAAEQFLSARGSDCGIANINIGTSGAEIGGAFGGEKDTGGGREAGSDSWKVYMRRQTNTINWGSDLPLAQGITFGD